MALTEDKIAIVSNVWVRQMHFKNKGDYNDGHVHAFDHITLLSKGSVTVTVDNIETDFVAPHMILIKKGAVHFLTAKEDDTVACCIHAIRTGEDVGDIIDPDMVPADATSIHDIPGARPLILPRYIDDTEPPPPPIIQPTAI